jgi:hypothetical protein
MRNNILKRFEQINEIGLAANKNGIASSVDQIDDYRYIIEWSNGVANDFDVEVQTSDFESFANPLTGLDSYVVINSGTAIKIDTASGNHVIDVDTTIQKFARIALKRNAGAMDVIATIRGSSIGG